MTPLAPGLVAAAISVPVVALGITALASLAPVAVTLAVAPSMEQPPLVPLLSIMDSGVTALVPDAAIPEAWPLPTSSGPNGSPRSASGGCSRSRFLK